MDTTDVTEGVETRVYDSPAATSIDRLEDSPPERGAGMEGRGIRGVDHQSPDGGEGVPEASVHGSPAATAIGALEDPVAAGDIQGGWHARVDHNGIDSISPESVTHRRPAFASIDGLEDLPVGGGIDGARNGGVDSQGAEAEKGGANIGVDGKPRAASVFALKYAAAGGGVESIRVAAVDDQVADHSA